MGGLTKQRFHVDDTSESFDLAENKSLIGTLFEHYLDEFPEQIRSFFSKSINSLKSEQLRLLLDEVKSYDKNLCSELENKYRFELLDNQKRNVFFAGFFRKEQTENNFFIPQDVQQTITKKI